MSGHTTILVADDDQNDVFFLRRAFQKSGVNHAVIAVSDGQQAIDYLQGEADYGDRARYPVPVLLLLDLKMPKVDGLEVLRQLKGDETLKRIPVVMLTSSREETDLVKSYRLGANAYVVKPVGFEQFADAIRQLGIFWAVLNEPPPDGNAV